MKKLLIILLLCSSAFAQSTAFKKQTSFKKQTWFGATIAGFSPVNTKNCYGFIATTATSVATGTGAGAVACSSITAGSSIFAVACAGFGNNPTTFNDAQGDSFSTFLIGGAGRYCLVGQVASSIGGAGEVTAGGMGTADQVVVEATIWTGLIGTDQQTSTNTGASPVSSGSTSATTHANELLIGVIYGRSGTLTPVGTGTFSGATTIYNLNLDSGNLNLSIQWITVSSTGTYAYTATVSNNTDETYIGTWH